MSPSPSPSYGVHSYCAKTFLSLTAYPSTHFPNKNFIYRLVTALKKNNALFREILLTTTKNPKKRLREYDLRIIEFNNYTT
jgi:hypothetical protein